ncbi:hypothetical protein C8N32_10273 [Rhodovulum imhoffii]|uniref:Glycosyl transferase family 25 n=1 Tax=Rhodovulum imhoffii TaxID=365340 RepID=A0A2T5BVE1_9RHOB|nr:hypothetical protein [Rhodovulum imhoffii]MBK5934201.1 hypothetical protein [Rhodovulum imhoffii]PTN03552.1 hypothetical protein C8N32_10273 [Rhodovulum imhoffii]
MTAFDLTTVACRVISLPMAGARRAHMQALLAGMGIIPEFRPGVPARRHALGCARAHLAATAGGAHLPLMVLEDDLALTGAVLPPLPWDADIVYLGVSQFGCLPEQVAQEAGLGHRAIMGLALAAEAGEDWLRLYSMAGAIAILYLSDRGLEAWRAAMRRSLETGRPFDVFTAYAMPGLRVFTPRRPLFYESADLQRPHARVPPVRRESWTRTPLCPVAEGDRRTGLTREGPLRVRAVRAGEGLAWKPEGQP